MPPTHSDHLEISHHRLSTISSLGGYSDQHAADIPTSKSLKRYRTSDHSDNDPDRHRPKQQPRDNSASSSNNPPHHDHGLAQIKRSSAEAAYDRPITRPQPRFPGENKSSLHPNPTQRPIGAPTVFVNGTEPIPIRSHHIIHIRILPPLHLPSLTNPRTPKTQRTRPCHTPMTTTYAPSRRPIHHHQQNSAHSPRSQALEGTIARHQHRP